MLHLTEELSRSKLRNLEQTYFLKAPFLTTVFRFWVVHSQSWMYWILMPLCTNFSPIYGIHEHIKQVVWCWSARCWYRAQLLLRALWILLFVEKVTIAVFDCTELIMKHFTTSSINWKTRHLKCIKNFQAMLIKQTRWMQPDSSPWNRNQVSKNSSTAIWTLELNWVLLTTVYKDFNSAV